MKAKGHIVVVNTADNPRYKEPYYLRALRKDFIDNSKSWALRATNERFKAAARRYRGTRGKVWYNGRLMPAYLAYVGQEMKNAPKVKYYSKQALRRAELQRRFDANGNVLVKLYDRIVAVVWQ